MVPVAGIEPARGIRPMDFGSAGHLKVRLNQHREGWHLEQGFLCIHPAGENAVDSAQLQQTGLHFEPGNCHSI